MIPIIVLKYNIKGYIINQIEFPNFFLEEFT